jgi:pantoate kinase
LQPKTALAFAPAVISNFFAIHVDSLSDNPPDYAHAGATGGGFTLSRGVYTSAWAVRGSARAISVVVNGDPNYPTETTRRSVELLLDRAGGPAHTLELVQTVEVPVGTGFGSSSASALSAVMAVAAALDLPFNKAEVASFAHQAEIVRRTGLGTVSSTYDQAGAAIITRAGGPGIARVEKVDVPRGLRVVTASLAPLTKEGLLSSPRMRGKVNRLGDAALERASDHRIESLLAAGQEFGQGLGLSSRAVKTLISISMKKGAIGAGQNMIGNAMHAVVRDEDSEKLMRALASTSSKAKVDSFRIGGRTARVLAE